MDGHVQIIEKGHHHLWLSQGICSPVTLTQLSPLLPIELT
uniref:Uncharacterized protein n=1 Tax=Rhizophora mucronata TaxID=61149 RepID=A0A2P2QNI4_RHIMU